MIHDKSRAFWVGASDTDKVMGNYQTATWKSWYLEKLGLRRDTLQTKAMKVGNAFEHKVLDTIPGISKDDQIILEDIGLRVNYDGILNDHIYEVKTYSADVFKVSKKYWQQAQVEILAYELMHDVTPELTILAYHVTEDDYANYFRPIDKERLSEWPIEKDPAFLAEYQEKLAYLHECIKKGIMP